MAWNASQTQGTIETIGAAVNTLIGTLSIKAGTMPNTSMVLIGSGKIIAVVTYEHS